MLTYGQSKGPRHRTRRTWEKFGPISLIPPPRNRDLQMVGQAVALQFVDQTAAQHIVFFLHGNRNQSTSTMAYRTADRLT